MKKFFALFVLALIAATVSSPVAAQESTPEALQPGTCSVDPVDAATYYDAVMASIPPLQQPIAPEGEAASDDVIDAVTETILQSIACTNAGDFARLLAVIDPSYAPTLIGVPYGDFEAALFALVEASLDATAATPMVDDIDQSELSSSGVWIGDVLDHGNGIVSAVATIDSDMGYSSTFTIYLRQQEETGAWVIFYYAVHGLVTPLIPAGF